MPRWITLILPFCLIACATEPPKLLSQQVSEIESVVDGHTETLYEMDNRVGQTNERITQQTISVSSLIQTQRRQSTQMDTLTDTQNRISRAQRLLGRKYRALKLLVIQTQLDEVRARIEFLRNRHRELETQLRDIQDADVETSDDEDEMEQTSDVPQD